MFQILFRKEVLENWRTNRLLILAVVLIAFGLLSPVTARFTPEIVKLAAGGDAQIDALAALIPTPTITDSVDQYLKNLTGIGMLVLVLLVMGLVAREKDKGTATMLLARPVGRTTFLAAKYTAFVLLVILCLLVAALACYIYTGLLFNAWLDPLTFIAINGLLLLYLLVPTTLTFLGSTLTRSSFAAAGIGLGGWALLGILGQIGLLADYMPGQLTSVAAGMARQHPFAGWPAVICSLLAIGVCLLLAALSFRQQEL